ncbi:MAG: hypothetical protein QME51_06575 [Planctomycetota bacterium]|nr:hypothetical protein [Planctomycetota bacterium]MDI6788017.1 hypothetical protein [Planctomycetota bacterium]
MFCILYSLTDFILCYGNQEDVEFSHIAGAIHLQTPASGGKRTIADYINLARRHEIGILVITDHDTQKYEYGLWPLRWLIKKTVDEPSVFRYGLEKYFAVLSQAHSISDDVLIIDGVESTPFYYWSGSYFKDNLTINDRGKHILVIGLNDIEAYKNLPLIGNGKSRFNQYQSNQGYAPYQDLIDYVRKKGGLTFWAHPEARQSLRKGNISVNTLPYPESLKATTNYTGFGVLWEGYQQIGLPGGYWDEVLREYSEGRRDKPVWAIGELDDYGDKEIDKVLTIFLLPKGKEKSYLAAIDALRTGKTYTILKAKDSPPMMLEEFFVYPVRSKSRLGGTAVPTLSERTSNGAYSGEELVTSSTPRIRVKISYKSTLFGQSSLLIGAGGRPAEAGQTPAPLSRLVSALASLKRERSGEAERALERGERLRREGKRIMATLKIIRMGKVIKEVNQPLPLSVDFKDDYIPRKGERICYRIEVTDEKGGKLISNPIFIRF